MGWYVFFIVPMGALLVGIIAGSGYGIASVWSGFRIGAYLAFAILALQIGVYFAAVYLHFRTLHLIYLGTGAPVPFTAYFHQFATAYTWRSANGQSSPMGNVGYVIRLIEISGFAVGGLIAPAFLGARPYCELCGIYMKPRHLMFFPASPPYRKLRPDDAEARSAYEEEQETAMNASIEGAEALMDVAEAGNAAAMAAAFGVVRPEQKSVAKLPCRIELRAILCKNCRHGTLEFNLLVGQSTGRQRRYLSETNITADFIEAIRRGI